MSVYETAKKLFEEWKERPVHQILTRTEELLGEIVRAGGVEQSKMEPHSVTHTSNPKTLLFSGPLWAALEYVASSTNESGGHFLVKKVEPGLWVNTTTCVQEPVTMTFRHGLTKEVRTVKSIEELQGLT